MPRRGPKGQRRPADVIVTGEEEDHVVGDGKDPAAKSLRSRGGKRER